MGKIYKRGRIWYFDVKYKKRRIRKRVGPSKRIAELALSEVEVQIAKEKFGFSSNDVEIERFFTDFLSYSRATHRSNSTERYRAVLDHFMSFLNQSANITFISEVTQRVIDNYKVYRKEMKVSANGKSSNSEKGPMESYRLGPKSNTINFELDTLRMLFNLAIKWGYIKENPTKGITRFKVEDAKPLRYLTKEECRLLMEHCDADLKRIFFILISTGMRKGELENLIWLDIDFDRKMILIRHKENWHPKSGERDIPMTEEVFETISKLNRERKTRRKAHYVFDIIGSGHSHNWLRLELIRAGHKAKIEDLTRLHTLRHTFASHLVMNGVDLPTVKKLMGHSDIETTMIYAHLSQDHLSEAVGKLGF